MSVETPRSSAGRDLDLGGVRRFRLSAVWVTVAAMKCTVFWHFGSVVAGDARGAQPDVPEPQRAAEIAEVEPFRYTEPEADLLLDEEGVRKRRALVLYYRGICLKGADMPAALEYFKQVIELDPSNVELAMETATYCAVYGKFSEALEILEKSLEENPENREAHLNISRYCDTHNNKDKELEKKAITYAEQAAEKFPLDHVVIEHLVTLLVTQGEKARAEKLLEKALEQEVKDGEYWLAMGVIAQQVWPMRKEENRERVAKVYEMALKADPQNLPMVEKVAQFYRLAGNQARSIQIYEALVRRSPDMLGARRALAELYWATGRAQEAVAGLEALVRINPEELEVRRTLAAFYQQMEKVEKAMEQLETVLKVGGAEVEDFLKLAELQLSADKFGGALQTLRRGVAIFPESPRLGYFLAMVYLDLKRYADAYRAFGEAQELAEAARPSLLNESFYFQYAMSAERCGEFEKAEELFRKSIELVPEDAQEDKAKSLNYLGYMWLEREQNIDEAGEMIKRANELKPDNGAYLDSLGWFYHLKGDFDQAIKQLLRAAELMEDQPDSVVFEHLARSYFANGDRNKAASFLERAIALEPDKAELKELRELFEKDPPTSPDTKTSEEGEKSETREKGGAEPEGD